MVLPTRVSGILLGSEEPPRGCPHQAADRSQALGSGEQRVPQSWGALAPQREAPPSLLAGPVSGVELPASPRI